MSKVKNFKDTKPIYQLTWLVREELDRLNRLRIGKVLTIIDASISDPEQRKGIKDLINKDFWIEDANADIMRMLIEFDQEFLSDKLSEQESNDYFNESPSLIPLSEFRSYFGRK